MNRDYFTKPIQAGGRSAFNYGNTRLDAREQWRSDRWLVPLIVGLFLALMMTGVALGVLK